MTFDAREQYTSAYLQGNGATVPAFNPIEHPVCFSYPERDVLSAWTQHIPFAMLLIDLLRPRQFVELGTHSGASYCAFCQAVQELSIDCRCFAIDNWKGDQHSGLYGPEILADLREHLAIRYESFSSLIQSQFDDACHLFADGSIDLLHIDGFHTYDVVRHDFDTWLPKLSERGVVVLHDIVETGHEFGVWKLWAELKAQYPRHIEFYHGHGLGVVAVGSSLLLGMRSLFDIPDVQWPAVRQLFRELGTRLEARSEARQLHRRLSSAEAREQELISTAQAERDAMAAHHQEMMEAREQELISTAQAERDATVASYQQRIDAVVADGEVKSKAAVQAERRRHMVTLASDRQLYEETLAAERKRLNDALWQLSWLESSRGVRLIKLARASRTLLKRKGAFALTKRVALWTVGKRGYHLRDIAADASTPATSIPPASGSQRTAISKAVIFISGCPGDAMRYRCTHQSEQLGYEGYTTHVATHGDVDLGAIVGQFSCFILHRVPYGPDVEWFIAEAHRQQKPVYFDTDDLVFDPASVRYVAALDDMDKGERDLYIDGLHRYRRTLQACDAVIVSTEPLRRYALEFHHNVHVVPNAVSAEMLKGAESALLDKASLLRRLRPSDNVTIGYFSGTMTHNKDFLQAADALLWALETYPETIVKIVGHLEVDERFARFGQRVVRLPLQPWQDLPRIYTTVDISIAPLESRNPFTESKSCIKYLEAALCKVPTVASPRADFRRTIVDGVTGFLAESPDQWKEALARLIESPDRRREMGQRAYESVTHEETSVARSAVLRETLRSSVSGIVPDMNTHPLTINWILRAPLAQRGGGYRAIFRIANYLGGQGHKVHIYVEPIAHLQGLSTKQILRFVEENFGPLACEVHVGHDNILPADVSVATNWPTATTVNQHPGSRFKYYYIQDFEPDFYDAADPQYLDAAATYELPLRQVCLGENLRTTIAKYTGRKPGMVDFAIDDSILRITQPPEERRGPPKVLFFARPGLKRRGFELGVESLRRIKAQRPDVDILLFGSTNDELGSLPFSATNLGVMTQDELARALNRVHVLLCFSLSNISFVGFEGMACGAAVVEADTPPVRDMVKAGETCLLATPSPDAVADAVLRLLADDALRCQIATCGAQFMAERTWRHTAAQFEEDLRNRCWLS